jgi:hypothetical protein
VVELLKALQDYQHVLLVAAIYIGWKKLKEMRDEDLRESKTRDAELDARISKAVGDALKNGVGEMMRRLIADHEVVEQRHLSAYLKPYEARIHELERALHWNRGGAT